MFKLAWAVLYILTELEARLAAAEADRDQGRRDYCDLMDRHDAHFVSWQSAKARAEKAEAEVERLKHLLDGDECPDPDKIDALFSRAEAAEAGEDALAKALRPFGFFSDEPNTTQQAWEIRYCDRFEDWIDFGDMESARDAIAAYEARRKG